MADEVRLPRRGFHSYTAKKGKGATDADVRLLRPAFCRAPTVRGAYNAGDMLQGTFKIATLTTNELESKCGAKDGLGESIADDLIAGITGSPNPEDIRIEAFDWTDLAGELSDYLPELATLAVEQATP